MAVPTKSKDKKIIGQRTTWTWPHYPETIYWLQLQRDDELKNDKAFRRFRRYRGINATIVILSASVVEGFLIECLESFADRFQAEDTMVKRLSHDYLRRLERANQYDRQLLFKIATGKTIDEHLGGEDVPIVKAISNLFKLRNCVAHARPISYVSHGEKHQDFDEYLYEMEGQFAVVEKYLIHTKKLLHASDGYSVNDLLENKCVDFFAEQVKPYIDEVLKHLNNSNKFGVQHSVNVAFRQFLK
jgi:hypothetical protein